MIPGLPRKEIVMSRNDRNRAKLYRSDNIADAWAHQQSENGRCPAAMTFEGRKFYSYATCVAEIVKHDGKTVFMVSRDNYSSSTSRHLSDIRSAIRGEMTFHVPGVEQGRSNIADLPRIFEGWQSEAERLLENSAQSREPKKSRLIVEAYQIVCQMRKLAEFFHVALDDYPVRLAVPDQNRVDPETYTRIIALRLTDPSPWMRNPAPGVLGFLSPSAPALMDALLASMPATQQAAA
jgi:hypothetical protein